MQQLHGELILKQCRYLRFLIKRKYTLNKQLSTQIIIILYNLSIAAVNVARTDGAVGALVAGVTAAGTEACHAVTRLVFQTETARLLAVLTPQTPATL